MRTFNVSLKIATELYDGISLRKFNYIDSYLLEKERLKTKSVKISKTFDFLYSLTFLLIRAVNSLQGRLK